MRNSAEPNIVGKVLMRAIQKYNFLLNLSHCVKNYGHLCQCYQNHSPNTIMSRDPGLRFQKFLFFSQFCVKFWEKLPNFWGNRPKNKKVTDKNKLGVENTPSAHRVKCHSRKLFNPENLRRGQNDTPHVFLE